MSRVYTQEQVDELMKCKDDPIYFGENYYTQIELSTGRNVLPLYDVQKKAMNSIIDHSVTIGCVSRQTGMTSTSCIYALWYALFHNDKTVGIICPKMQNARNVLKRIKESYEVLPPWMKMGVKSWNSQEVVFANDSKIILSSSHVGFRGCGVDVLMISDAAYFKNEALEDMWDSIVPIVSSRKDGKIFIWSTPNGKGFFKTLYDKGKSNHRKFSNWNSIKITWDDIPHRNEKWKQGMVEALGEKAFKKEMECKF